jgi:ADP-heptose:LPS heptosyltransferase
LLIDYPGGWRSTRSTRAAIRRERWDLCIDLTTDYHLKPAWLAAASGAPIRVGFENSGRERFFNLVIPKLDSEHMADRFRRPLEVLGITSGNRSMSFIVPNIDVTLPAARPGQRRVGLHPGAAHPTQRWPVDHFASLARKIAGAGDQCLVLGRECEKDIVGEIVLKSGGAAIPVPLSGDILEFATILKSLDLLVCNNSGPLHLAGLLEVPTVSFMGPTVKERWWPRGAKARVLRRDELPCIGCNLGYCRIRTHACMKEITPEMAFEEVSSC